MNTEVRQLAVPLKRTEQEQVSGTSGKKTIQKGVEKSLTPCCKLIKYLRSIFAEAGIILRLIRWCTK